MALYMSAVEGQLANSLAALLAAHATQLAQLHAAFLADNPHAKRAPAAKAWCHPMCRRIRLMQCDPAAMVQHSCVRKLRAWSTTRTPSKCLLPRQGAAQGQRPA